MADKPNTTWIGSPNFGYPQGAHGRGGRQVVAIVHHIMQGSLAGTDSWFQNTDSGASTHFGIGADGSIHQYVDMGDCAWGNGLMQKPDLSIPWLKDCWDNNLNPNRMTVSIEHEGAHSVKNGATVPDWQPTEAQYQASLALTRWLCEQFGLAPDNNTVIGHYRIDAVSRPYCPGPLFPFSRMLGDLNAHTWSLPTVRVVKLDGSEMWGAIEDGKTMVDKGGERVWIREDADFLGAHCRFAPNPPTVYLDAPAQPPADGGKYQRV